MSFGGYGGSSADPFGGQPFGGGWSGPPTYQAPPPPPPSQQTNPLATLSIVFAFLFAPAGVVLGHVALSQIKRLHQKGRDRAIIGLVLSYFMIVVVVAALVVWLVILPSGSANSKVLVSYLLTSEDLNKLVGGTFTPSRDTTFGGRDDMEVLASRPSPAECTSTLYPAVRSSYESKGVRGYASGSWIHEGRAPVSFVVDAVVALSSAEEARSTFDEFSRQWHDCSGQTITSSADATTSRRYDVTAVSAVAGTDTVIAHLNSDSSSFTHITRAIGVHRNFIVELKCSFWDDSLSAADLERHTTDGVHKIFDKIDKAR